MANSGEVIIQLSIEDLGAWIAETEQLLTRLNYAFTETKRCYLALKNGDVQKAFDKAQAEYDRFRTIGASDCLKQIKKEAKLKDF